jgi:hypothetical protein
MGEFLRPANLKLFLTIAWWMPVLRLLLVRMDMADLLARLDQPHRNRRTPDPEDLKRADTGRRYANFLWVTCLRRPNPCLVRSLALFYVMRKQGLDIRIHFGIDKDLSPLSGHSWISSGSNSLFEPHEPLLRYADVYAYPPEP